MFVGLTIH